MASLAPQTQTQSAAPADVVLLLHLKIEGTKKTDLFGKPDPFVVLFVQANPQCQFECVGLTETLQDMDDGALCEFTTPFSVPYKLGVSTMCNFRVYDRDGLSDDLKRHDFLGEFTTPLAQLAGRSESSFAILLNDNSNGRMTINAERQVVSNETLQFQPACSGIPNMDGPFGRPDTYVKIYRLIEGGGEVLVFNNEDDKVMDNNEPVFPLVSLPIQEFAGGNVHARLRVEVWDWDDHSDHDLVGSFETSISEMSTSSSFDITKEVKKTFGGTEVKTRGHFHPQICTVQRRYGLFDFNDIELCTDVTIDGTGSNRRGPVDLHTADEDCNQYIQALKAVLDVLEKFDSDGKHRVSTFGIRCGGSSEVDFDFNLSTLVGRDDGEVEGIDGVLEAYRAAFHHPNSPITLWGPTDFAPTIRNAAARCGMFNPAAPKYKIQLIFTDGAITDMAATKVALASAANKAVSFIIIGIGDADFSQMVELDGDGDTTRVDNVTFIKYNDYVTLDDLRRAALEEFPNQAASFFERNNIVPVGVQPPAAPAYA